jgi:hypothetical protein
MALGSTLCNCRCFQGIPPVTDGLRDPWSDPIFRREPPSEPIHFDVLAMAMDLGEFVHYIFAVHVVHKAGEAMAEVAEHKKLARSTRHLTEAFGESRQAPGAASGQLADQLMHFLDFYRHHMLTEDQHFFPLALQRLSPDDFAEIDFRLFDQPDPLLDQKAEGLFADLREEIARLGTVEKTLSGRREKAALLATIRDLATFNGNPGTWCALSDLHMRDTNSFTTGMCSCISHRAVRRVRPGALTSIARQLPEEHIRLTRPPDRESQPLRPSREG